MISNSLNRATGNILWRKLLKRIWLIFVAFLALSYAGIWSVYAQDEKYPTREGPRPETTLGVPHIQIGAIVKPNLYTELLQRTAKLPHLEIRDTIISLPGAKGFWILEDLTLKRPDVIVGGREFAHIHPDGSLHASLDPKDARAAIDAGWAVAHPWSNRQAGWEGFVMIYTPTNQLEVDIIFHIITDAYEYVTGLKISNLDQ